ncbi:hypothetical protein [Streptomyces sp. NBC_00872]|nr:hypothetical protein OG214_12850 [Streptomyces sp. NBC_00872]
MPHVVCDGCAATLGRAIKRWHEGIPPRAEKAAVALVGFRSCNRRW